MRRGGTLLSFAYHNVPTVNHGFYIDFVNYLQSSGECSGLIRLNMGMNSSIKKKEKCDKNISLQQKLPLGHSACVLL